MRASIRIIIALWIVVSACLGCSGSKDALKDLPPSMVTAVPAKGYINSIALLLAHTPPTALGRQIGERYAETLINAIGDESGRVRLVTPGDAQFPDFLMETAQEAPAPGNVVAMAEAASVAGYNGWVIARIEGLRHEAKHTGFFWFRKMRYFAHCDLNLAFYDAITGAKMINEVIESSTKISEDEYNAIKTGEAGTFEELNAVITEIGEGLGEKVAQTLDDQPWRTMVVNVEGGRISLPVGARAGLRSGDRLAVFEGRRTLEGQNGERFFVPGFQVGEIEIVAVTDQTAEAEALGALQSTKIQVGDFAAAVK